VEKYAFYAESQKGKFYGVLMAWSEDDARETIERKIGPTNRLEVHQTQIGIFVMREIADEEETMGGPRGHRL